MAAGGHLGFVKFIFVSISRHFKSKRKFHFFSQSGCQSCQGINQEIEEETMNKLLLQYAWFRLAHACMDLHHICIFI